MRRAIGLDSFLKISLTDAATANDLLRKLDKISEKFGVTFVISISLEGADIAEDLKKYMIGPDGCGQSIFPSRKKCLEERVFGTRTRLIFQKAWTEHVQL